MILHAGESWTNAPGPGLASNRCRMGCVSIDGTCCARPAHSRFMSGFLPHLPRSQDGQDFLKSSATELMQ